MEYKLKDLHALYLYIFSSFAKNEHLAECKINDKFLNAAYNYNDNVLTMKKELNSNESANFIIRRGAKISLSENKQVILITQELQNNETKQILMYIDAGKVMVVDGVLAVQTVISGKKFVFKEEKVVETTDYYNDGSNKEEENKEYNDSKNYVDTNEANNVMNNSAFIEPSFIKIKEELLPYGDHIQEQYEYQGQDKYLLGAFEDGYTLEHLCQDIGENQKYCFFGGDLPSHIFPKDDEGYFIVHFPLHNVCYNPLRYYKMSDDEKVLYEYDIETKSIVSATYYDNDNNVHVTNNRDIINSFLQEHQAEFDDDVFIDDQSITDNDNFNNIINENKSSDDKRNSNSNIINEDYLNNSSFSKKNKVNNKNGNNANKNKSSGNITGNNNEEANKEKLQKVGNESNKIDLKDNNYEIISHDSKKNVPQLEGYEPKTKNDCNCNLDCLEWCKRLF